MINTAIESVIGPGTHVMARTGPNVYFAQRTVPDPRHAGARESITRAIVSFEGLARRTGHRNCHPVPQPMTASCAPPGSVTWKAAAAI